jgi:Leucine-rich repeat (LRR) protein
MNYCSGLNLSNNCITLDTSNQITIFRDGITPLDKLESLSLAGNKIQDRGFEIVQRIVIDNFPNLKLLDLAGCFVSSLSYSHLANLLGLSLPSGWPRLDEILFQNNLLNHTHYQELLSEFGDRPMRCKFSPSSAYIGIEFPLRYNLRDFGVDN